MAYGIPPSPTFMAPAEVVGEAPPIPMSAADAAKIGSIAIINIKGQLYHLYVNMKAAPIDGLAEAIDVSPLNYTIEESRPLYRPGLSNGYAKMYNSLVRVVYVDGELAWVDFLGAYDGDRDCGNDEVVPIDNLESIYIEPTVLSRVSNIMTEHRMNEHTSPELAIQILIEAGLLK